MSGTGRGEFWSDQLPDMGRDMVRQVRLGQEPAPRRKVGRFGSNISGGKKQRNPRPLTKGVMNQLEPAHRSRHAVVGEQHVDIAGLCFQQGNRTRGMFRLEHGESLIRQKLDGDCTQKLLVLCHDDDNLCWSRDGHWGHDDLKPICTARLHANAMVRCAGGLLLDPC